MSTGISNNIQQYILRNGQTHTIFDGDLVGTGVEYRDAQIYSDALYLGLSAPSVDDTTTVTVVTYDGTDLSNAKEVLNVELTAASPSWALYKTSACLSRVRVSLTYTGNTTLRVVLKPTMLDEPSEVSFSASLDGLTGQGVQGVLNLTANTPVEVKVNATQLSNRKLILVDNISGGVIYWGYDSGVSASSGISIYDRDLASWEINPTKVVSVWIVSTANSSVRVVEGI